MLTPRTFAEIGIKLIAIYYFARGMENLVFTAMAASKSQYWDKYTDALLSSVGILIAAALIYMAAGWGSRFLTRKMQFEETALPDTDEQPRTDLVRAILVGVGAYLVVMAMIASGSILLRLITFSPQGSSVELVLFNLASPVLQVIFGLVLILGSDKLKKLIQSQRPLKSG